MDYEKMLEQVRRTPRVNGYVSPNTETRESPIQGLGLFARQEIPAHEVVAVWGGKVTTKEEVEKLPEDIGYHYALELHPGFYLAADESSHLMAWVPPLPLGIYHLSCSRPTRP